MNDVMMNISYFGMSFLDPYLMFLTAAGVFFGIYVGAIPGLSVTMAVSILISFTFKWRGQRGLGADRRYLLRRRLWGLGAAQS